MQAERAPFPWVDRWLRNLSRADSGLIGLSFSPDPWKLTICKFEKGEFCRILLPGVCLLIFMKVNIHQREGAGVVASELSLPQIDFKDYIVALSQIRGISLLHSYWILIWGLEWIKRERERIEV